MQKLIRHRIVKLSCYLLLASVSFSPIVNASLMSSMANMKDAQHDLAMDMSCDQHPHSMKVVQKSDHGQSSDTDSYNCMVSDACALHCVGSSVPLPPLLIGLVNINKSFDWRTPIIQVPAFLSSFTLDRPPRS